ncbi:glycosyltransferase [Phytomonospora endophytica]|uniref:Vancomycin aglycone glucosyltransferase n=1 Tax=Phytomonospora endophytica TaxID=714109 RepID=A0A841FD10_9ACTN|nr:glycosyltransferase [Phytomonospora endophytica]MBB6035171.1 vancomycin aglycone glucosyltransferase [Phytomonospora endophytica]GIG64080.1 glycosyl transferase [Phytomonospora endophytica]
MRVLLTTTGSRGDVEPVVALALRLRARDAEVRVCAPPDFAALFADAGMPMTPLGPSVRAFVAGAKPPTPADALRMAADLVAERFELLAAEGAGCDVILAAGLLPVGARDVAEVLGVRYVFACYQLFGLPSRHFPAAVSDPARLNMMYREPLNAHRAALGLSSVDNVRDHVFTEHPWLAADPVLSPGEGMTDLDLVQTGAWIRPDTRPLPGALEAFLAAGEAPVYIGFGSMPMRAPDAASVAVAAARANGRRVVLGSGWADLASADDADDCFVVGEVNQQELFGRVAAAVHHGGAGTTTTAARAGAPQVLVPQMGDQPYWAARVAELGIGAAHDEPAPTVESLAAALEIALAPATRGRAGAVAARIRDDGADVAARLLLGGDGR